MKRFALILLLLSCSEKGRSGAVTIKPELFRVPAGGKFQFAATVSGVDDQRVAWSISPQQGSIDEEGVFVAPDPLPISGINQRIAVTATSVANPDLLGTASAILVSRQVRVDPPISVARPAAVAPAVFSFPLSTGQFQTIDFNGDIAFDLAAVSPDEGTVTLLLGDGEGRFFTYPVTLPGARPIAVAAGEFSSGSATLADLAVADANGALWLIRGVRCSIKPSQTVPVCGEGSFSPVGPIPLSGKSPSAIGIGSFDSDDLMDIVVANLDDLALFRGTGPGEFKDPPTLLDAGGKISGLAVGDFDGDGKDDILLTIDRELSAVAFFSRDFSFERVLFPLAKTPIALAARPAAIRAGFLVPAIFVTIDSDGDLSVYLQKGREASIRVGTPGSGPTNCSLSSAGRKGLAVVIEDFNQDQNLDIAAAMNGSLIRIFLGRGDGTFPGCVDHFVGSEIVSLASGLFVGFQSVGLAAATAVDQRVIVLVSPQLGAPPS